MHYVSIGHTRRRRRPASVVTIIVVVVVDNLAVGDGWRVINNITTTCTVDVTVGSSDVSSKI